MAELLNQNINKAFDLEERGYFEEAIQLCNKCIQAFPEYEEEIELEIAKMNYRNGKEETALVQFLTLYEETGERDIFDLILEVFYYSRQKEYDKQYKENYKQLENYAYFYGEPDVSEIYYYPILAGKQNIWYYDGIENKFKVIKNYKFVMEEPVDSVFLGSDLLWIEDILLLEKMTRKQNPLLGMENPLLLVYRRDTWELLLQMLDLKELLDFGRIVFYDDAKRLEASILEDGISFPERVLRGDSSDKIIEIINNIHRKYEEECVKYKAEASTYYKMNGDKVIRHIKEGIPKVLFITSRFTTALQYHVKGCKAAAERMNLETELFIEKDRLCRGDSVLLRLKRAACFKPDIIFCIDHFRFEHTYLDGLEEIVWVCWVQDLLPLIKDKSSPSRLCSRDIILNHCTTWKKFFEIGYDTRRLLDAPIPADPNIYKAYTLEPEEKARYSCDICFVCHASNVDSWIAEKMEGISEQNQVIFQELYKGYQRVVYETGKCFYAEEQFRQYVIDVLQRFGISIEEEMVNMIAEDMFLWLNQRVYRQALVDWLLDGGFVNLKLWGNGWTENHKYAAYAMGPADNGETLSKIYQASKIVVGNNVMCTASARAWESMLSGAFYMSNYVPMEDDVSDIRRIMKEDEELVMFRDREDFLHKVEYYLSHEEERQRMAEIGHEVVLRKMTFDKLMSRMIREIPNRIEQLEKEET